MGPEYRYPALAVGQIKRGTHMNVTGSQELREFLDGWKTDPQNAKAAFVSYMVFLAAHRCLAMTVKSRPALYIPLRCPAM